MACYLLNECARKARLLVSRTPYQQLQEHRSQINSLLRQPVVHPSRILLFRFRDDDPGCFELPQTIRQNVRRNPFTGP